MQKTGVTPIRAAEHIDSNAHRDHAHASTRHEDLAGHILAACGPGNLLDIGCGLGHLVHALVARGVDAHGIDTSSDLVRRAESLTPGRFAVADIRDLSHPDGAFETIVCTATLEHLAEDDVPRAIAQLARVSRKNVFVRIDTAAADDEPRPLTLHDRAWWESKFFAAGLRKHPRSQRVVPFHALESEDRSIIIVLERIPDDALARYPLERLAAERNLHMDMLRESGRRSDAHLARYVLAASLVRPDDAILDVSCGLGYGSHLLAHSSAASSVLGVDIDPGAVEYAAHNYATRNRADSSDRPRVSYRPGDAADLSFIPDASVDLVVCFETLEHVPDPDRVIREFRRVLTPGGRLIASVPNRWDDEFGKDPSPYHLRVYDWNALQAQIAPHLIIERAFRQVAGGGPKLADRPRLLDEIAFDPDPAAQHAIRMPVEAEWWLAVAMKDPLDTAGADPARIRYVTYPDLPDYNVTAFARDYANPWLFRALADTGVRCANPAVLERLCRRVIQTSDIASPERGLALCVLAYRALEASDLALAAELDAPLHAFTSAVGASPRSASPHAVRWHVSNLFVRARLLLLRGLHAQARDAFLACARADYAPFSPLLASKPIDARFHAGLLALAAGDADDARACWIAGIREAHRALTAPPWTNVWGTPENPLAWGLHDAAIVLDLASRCSGAINALDSAADAPGFAWEQIRRQSFADSREWIQKLSRDNAWLRERVLRLGDAERRDLDRVAALKRAIARFDGGSAWLQANEQVVDGSPADHERMIESLRAYNEELRAGAEWHQAQDARARAEIERLRAWADELKAGIDWHAAELLSRDRAVAELREWNERLEQSVRWHAEHAARIQQESTAKSAEIERLAAWTRELDAARAWADSQRASLAQSRADDERALADSKAWTDELQRGLDWMTAERDKLAELLRQRDAAVTELQEWSAELKRALEWMTAQRDRWEAAARARHDDAIPHEPADSSADSHRGSART